MESKAITLHTTNSHWLATACQLNCNRRSTVTTRPIRTYKTGGSWNTKGPTEIRSQKSSSPYERNTAVKPNHTTDKNPPSSPTGGSQGLIQLESSPTMEKPPLENNPRSDYDNLQKKITTQVKQVPKKKYTQLTLPTTTTKELNQHPKDTTWGHQPEQIDAETTFWVIFQNPRGLKLTTDPIGTQFRFSMAQAIGAGALCLAETKVNWSLCTTETKFKGILRKTWQHTNSIMSNTEDNFSEEHQPGGTLAMVCGNRTSRVIEKRTDPFGLGRWTYITLRGKGTSKILNTPSLCL